MTNSMKLTLFALFTNLLRDEWFRKKRVLPHSLHRYPEPVIADMEEMNAPVSETLKTEYQHHLVPDVLFFHEAPYCPYIAFFKSSGFHISTTVSSSGSKCVSPFLRLFIRYI